MAAHSSMGPRVLDPGPAIDSALGLNISSKVVRPDFNHLHAESKIRAASGLKDVSSVLPIGSNLTFEHSGVTVSAKIVKGTVQFSIDSDHAAVQSITSFQAEKHPSGLLATILKAKELAEKK